MKRAAREGLKATTIGARLSRSWWWDSRLTKMLTIHWGASQSQWCIHCIPQKKMHKDLGRFQAFWSKLKCLTNLCHQKWACPAGTSPSANQRTLLWRADSRRRTLQVNQNHSKNRQNTSREMWVFRTPTKMAKHVILYRLHCKHFWKCKKGSYFS